jgi:hypothetical protein
MQHYEIWIQNSRPKLEVAFEQVQGVVCGALLLCARAGCKCAVGKGKKLCSEAYHGTTLRVSASEGPNWFTIAYLLRETLHVQIYLDDLPNVEQRIELERALRALGGQLYWAQDWKAATLEEQLGY